MTSTTRRAFFSTAAAAVIAPAAILPALANVGADPIFAAIEAYRIADAACVAVAGDIPAELAARLDDAWHLVIATRATTPAGLAALTTWTRGQADWLLANHSTLQGVDLAAVAASIDDTARGMTGLVPWSPPAAPTASSDARALALWADRQAAVERLRVSSDAYREASDKLPVWAQSGPRMIDHQGNPCGDDTGWPLDETVKPASNPGARRISRPSPADCRENFEFSVRVFHFTGQARRNARDRMNRKIAAINARCAERDRLYDQLGLTELDRLGGVACDEIVTADRALFDLPTATPNVTAARLLVAVCDNVDRGNVATGQGYCGTMALAMVALTPLLPNLSGLIRDHAALFVENPTLPLGNMPFAPV